MNDVVEQFEPTRYKLPNSLFLNEKGGFRDVSAEAGAEFQAPRAHRGAAFADFNGDGRIDVAVSCLGEGAELWENVSPGDGEWLIVKLVGVQANRDGIGARVKWGNQWNVMTSSVGYSSSSHFGVHFGAPKGQSPDTLEIWWPGGGKQVVNGVKSRQVIVVKEH